MEIHMARPVRTIMQGVTYHCYSRCLRKRYFFNKPYAKKFLVDAINMCQEKYNFELFAAEPVGNHIHLVIRTLENEETISRIMQYIKARVAEKFNRKTGETGPFWNERFGCRIIEEADDPKNYLLKLLWYIGFNPVRKNLSSDPRKNYIGFINCYLNKDFKCAVKTTLHRFFIELGNTFEERVKKFLWYEEAYRKRMALFF